MDEMTGALSGARTSMSRSKQRSPGSIISDISCSLITDKSLRLDTLYVLRWRFAVFRTTFNGQLWLNVRCQNRTHLFHFAEFIY